MIVWGGIGTDLDLDTEGRYCAGTDETIHLSVDADGIDSLLTWTMVAGATGYDVVRGSLSALRETGGDYSDATDACLLAGVDVDHLVDADPVGPAEGLWYLVRPAFGTSVGTYDSGGSHQAASRDAAINASTLACP